MPEQQVIPANDGILDEAVASFGDLLLLLVSGAERWPPSSWNTWPGCVGIRTQIATDTKSNEIKAVPALLEMLALKGTIVTADALNCQREIARTIIDKGGDYALALKGNQGTLHDDVRRFLDDPACSAQVSKACAAERNRKVA